MFTKCRIFSVVSSSRYSKTWNERHDSWCLYQNRISRKQFKWWKLKSMCLTGLSGHGGPQSRLFPVDSQVWEDWPLERDLRFKPRRCSSHMRKFWPLSCSSVCRSEWVWPEAPALQTQVHEHVRQLQMLLPQRIHAATWRELWKWVTSLRGFFMWCPTVSVGGLFNRS